MSNEHRMDSSHGCPRAHQSLRKAPRWLMWAFPFIGLISLIWFLVRVIPKPARAAYPCQRVAAPLASSFVLWAVGVFSSIVAFHKAKGLLRRSRLALAGLCMVLGLAGVWVAVQYVQQEIALAITPPFVPGDPALSPVGTPQGVQPGRVVWLRDVDATDWDGITGYWWEDAHSDQGVINEMMSNGIRWLTGEATVAEAWDAIFRYHNGGTGYTPGEKIAIKVNLVNAGSPGYTNTHEPSPQLLYALAAQLIFQAGVAPGDILVYDSSHYIPNAMYDKLSPLGITFGERHGLTGRLPAVYDPGRPIHFSNDKDHDTMYMSWGRYDGPFHPATYHTAATYFINFAALKGHAYVGGTVCAKNYFGCTYNFDDQQFDQGWGPGAYGGLHKFVRTSSDGGWTYPIRPYGTYSALVDLMGHDEFGGKAILYMIDGLYASRAHNTLPTRYQSFGPTDWASCIFFSQDPVAIDSVALDMLRYEPVVTTMRGAVDNYLHEAAQADDPPSGTFYDPNHEGNVERLPSLGVHEHWDNSTERLYSRNLGMDFGVELIRSRPMVSCRLFYNNSVGDGGSALPGPADDGAIATDKLALRPGGEARSVNLSCYHRGINGVMIDLADASGVSATDFEFAVGSLDDPQSWQDAPAPQSVTVRPGPGGTDRVTIIWGDGEVAATWLAVTVRATPATGLSNDEVFYLASLPGDFNLDGQVTGADYTAWANTFGNDGSEGKEDLRADANADGTVSGADYVAWANNFGSNLP